MSSTPWQVHCDVSSGSLGREAVRPGAASASVWDQTPVQHSGTSYRSSQGQRLSSGQHAHRQMPNNTSASTSILLVLQILFLLPFLLNKAKLSQIVTDSSTVLVVTHFKICQWIKNISLVKQTVMEFFIFYLRGKKDLKSNCKTTTLFKT